MEPLYTRWLEPKKRGTNKYLLTKLKNKHLTSILTTHAVRTVSIFSSLERTIRRTNNIAALEMAAKIKFERNVCLRDCV